LSIRFPFGPFDGPEDHIAAFFTHTPVASNTAIVVKVGGEAVKREVIAKSFVDKRPITVRVHREFFKVLGCYQMLKPMGQPAFVHTVAKNSQNSKETSLLRLDPMSFPNAAKEVVIGEHRV
jgi:hypothetical protein